MSLESRFSALEEAVSSLPGLVSRALALMLDLDMRAHALDEIIEEKSAEYLKRKREEIDATDYDNNSASKPKKARKEHDDGKDAELSEIKELREKQNVLLNEKMHLAEQNLHLIVSSRHAVGTLLRQALSRKSSSSVGRPGNNVGPRSEVSGTATLRRSTRKSLFTGSYNANSMTQSLLG